MRKNGKRAMVKRFNNRLACLQPPFIKTLTCENGALTVEAALISGIVLIACLSWIFLFSVWETQSNMQEILDQSALTLADKISWQENLWKEVSGNINLINSEGLSRAGKEILPESMKEDINNMMANYGAQKVFDTYLKNGPVGKGGNSRLSNISLECKIDDDNDNLTLVLDYDIELWGLLKFLGPLSIRQNSKTGIWLLTDDPIGLGSGEGEDKEDNSKNSIWQETAFKRGREFVKKYKGAQYKRVKSGQRIDYIDGNGSAVAIYSLNIFSKSYSTGEGYKAQEYKINEDAFKKKLGHYINDFRKQLDKEGDLIMDGGRTVKRPKSGKLLMILPEEAAIFKGDLERMTNQVDKIGVGVEYRFDQKALIKEEEPKK